MSHVNCDICNGSIKTKNDLVVAFDIFTIKAYHSSCYAKELKTLRTLLVSNRPINTDFAHAVTNMLLGVALILGSWNAWQAFTANTSISTEAMILPLLLMLPMTVQLRSWYKYEQYF